MNENNKPEWFEIVEKDGLMTPSKASKSLPLAAIIAAALVLGVGAFIAQPQEQTPANALEKASLQTSTPIKTLQNPAIAKSPNKGVSNEDKGEND
jgi:hypothetical protein